MIPGLIDAHGHVLSYGLSLLRVDLVGAVSESEASGSVLDLRKPIPLSNGYRVGVGTRCCEYHQFPSKQP